jgi:spore maturation protein CgeB
MINKTVILLAPSHHTEHELSKYVASYLVTGVPSDIYFFQPLQAIFSKVIAYDYTTRITKIGFKAVNEEVIDLVEIENAEYVLWLSARYEFSGLTFDTLRKKTGAIIVGWFFDDETHFDDYSKWWIPYLDYFVTNDIQAVPKYKELGARAIQAYCTGIPVDHDWSGIMGNYGVSFVGTRSADREQFINEFRKRNIPIALFGREWAKFVSFREMIDIFGASKINLNFSKAGSTPQIKARIFEVCLAGGFLLTEYVSGIERYFEIDKEIVCFHNKEEMIEKTIYYLNHDEERQTIAQAGWKRATNEYTCFHILSMVFDEIEKDIASRGGGSSPHPENPQIPMRIRRRVSAYYANWVKAFSLENYKGLWQDAFMLSIYYNPLNGQSWLYYILGFLPYHMRLSSYKLVRSALIGLHRLQKNLVTFKAGKTKYINP